MANGETLLNKGVAGYFVPCALVLEDDIRERVQFESFPTDEGITEGYNADFAKTMEGISAEPIRRTWQGGDWNAINITLNFVAGLSPLDVGPTGRAIGKMVGKVNWLKATTLPRPSSFTPAGVKKPPSAGANKKQSYQVELGALAGRPPFVLLVWGLFMVLRGRIQAWTVQWNPPFDPITGKPQSAIVSLTFMPENGFFPNWYSVRDTGGSKVPSSIVGKFI